MDLHQVSATKIKFFKNADTRILANNYSRLLLKTRLATQNIWFFNKCISNEVYPNYIKLKSDNKSSSAKRGIITGQLRWIKSDRKIQYNNRDKYNIFLKVIHSELVYRLKNTVRIREYSKDGQEFFELDMCEFDHFDRKIREKIDYIIQQKFIKQSSKLKTLIEKKSKMISTSTVANNNKYSNHVFSKRFINFTNVNFNETETNLIEKGFNFNLFSNNNQNNIEKLGVECESILNKFINYPSTINITTHKHILSTKILEHATFRENYPSFDSTVKSIKLKSKLNNIIFTRADKAKTVIALDKSDYINKTISFLHSNNYTELNNDPTLGFQKIIVDSLHNNNLITEKEVRFLKVMNPQAPRLYSFIKLHKEGHPIRPVVSCINSPNYLLSKKLTKLLEQHCKFIPKYTIKNSLELINSIKDIEIPHNCILVSFDVKNLFPSVPQKEAIKIIEQMLFKTTDPQTAIELMNLLNICLSQNYFEFNNEFYSIDKGLIMGNPLSPLLAEVFMDYLEQKIFQNPKFKNKFKFYKRYVDDIIAAFMGSRRELQIFLNFLNSLHPFIEFTIEVEENNQINFLDITITKINNKLDFSIFHKPSHTDITIHNSSLHPYSHKLAAYYCYIHRLLNVPLSTENYSKELNIIKQIAYNNGYDPDLIDKIIQKKQFSKAINMVALKPKTTESFHVITYMGNISNKIAKYLKSLDINIAFRTDNSLGKFIKNNKTKVDTAKLSGVYKLICGTEGCNQFYIGQTGRSFSVRINEHRKQFSNKNSSKKPKIQTSIKKRNTKLRKQFKQKLTKSNYAYHLIKENHLFNDNFKILHIANKGRLLNLLETLEINKGKGPCLLNDQVDLNNSPLLNLKSK